MSYPVVSPLCENQALIPLTGTARRLQGVGTSGSLLSLPLQSSCAANRRILDFSFSWIIVSYPAVSPLCENHTLSAHKLTWTGCLQHLEKPEKAWKSLEFNFLNSRPGKPGKTKSWMRGLEKPGIYFKIKKLLIINAYVIKPHLLNYWTFHVIVLLRIF